MKFAAIHSFADGIAAHYDFCGRQTNCKPSANNP
jgi:hypothetical protein